MAKKTPDPARAFNTVFVSRGGETLEFASEAVIVGEGETFRQWCEGLSQERIDAVTGEKLPGLKVEGRPFKLDDRPAFAWIYDQVPSTREQAFRGMLVLRKCAQVGFTVMEMLATIYLALKFEPLKIGMFLPGRDLAAGKSSERFMPIARTVPAAYKRMTEPDTNSGAPSKGEGNVMIRRMGGSLFHFLHTSGRVATESYPMDVISFDEVQEMLIKDMEKAQERLSASNFKFTIMGSTANWPDADIDYWYKKGSQHRLHTRCPTCGVAEPLDDYFPQCIEFDPTFPDRVTGVPGDYRYVCRAGHWIDDPQDGDWVPDNPEALLRKITSIHFHQMLSPTISPREMYEAYIGADDLKNFYNRKLGKPYQDPSQVPVSLAHLNACAEEGMRVGIVWKRGARNTFMGIDQMGAFNVAIIKERLEDGRQALVHAEFIYNNDPFARCDELMRDYGVQVCVVEQLPNFNDAQRFAQRHEGRVFLCNGYGEIADDVMRWGDAKNPDVSDRRTEESEQTRYTVRIDQYKAMQMSLARLVKTQCLFPDPQALRQVVHEKEARTEVAILKDVIFTHFQKTALVTERINEGERKLRRRVVKVGIDPHASYANMLCDIAWARAHTTSTFLAPASAGQSARPLPSIGRPAVDRLPGSPSNIARLIDEIDEQSSAPKCRDCSHYPLAPNGTVPEHGQCPILRASTPADYPTCLEFDPHSETYH